jgi:hypothetical protein
MIGRDQRGRKTPALFTKFQALMRRETGAVEATHDRSLGGLEAMR